MSVTSRPLGMSGAGFGCGRYRLDMTLDAPDGTAGLPVNLRSTGVTWSIHVRSLATGLTFGLDDGAALSTASVGKVLLRRVGVDAMDQVAQALGFEGVRLHDFVRDVRRETDPPRLSSGSAQELARYFAMVASGEIISPAVSGILAGWLGLSTDLSMVASSLGLDPLAHSAGGHGLSLMNKTGTDVGVRADCGLVSYNGLQVAYAAIANWDEASVPALDLVMADMRTIGGFVRSLVEIEVHSGA